MSSVITSTVATVITESHQWQNLWQTKKKKSKKILKKKKFKEVQSRVKWPQFPLFESLLCYVQCLTLSKKIFLHSLKNILTLLHIGLGALVFFLFFFFLFYSILIQNTTLNSWKHIKMFRKTKTQLLTKIISQTWPLTLVINN